MEGPWGQPPAYEPPSAEARAALAQAYAGVDAALAPAASACRACGKCCRFEPGGIILFASAIELAYLVTEMGGMPKPSLAGHASAVARGTCPRQQRRGHATRSDADSWRCPYQRENLCTARGARLLGCRTYFCDARAREAGEGVHAEALREVRRIAAGQGPWWYGPARAYLDRALQDV